MFGKTSLVFLIEFCVFRTFIWGCDFCSFVRGVLGIRVDAEMRNGGGYISRDFEKVGVF